MLIISDYPANGLSDNPTKISDNPHPPDFRDTISASAHSIRIRIRIRRISKSPYHILVSDGFGADRILSDPFSPLKVTTLFETPYGYVTFFFILPYRPNEHM